MTATTADLLLIAAAERNELAYRCSGAAVFTWRGHPVDDDTKHQIVALINDGLLTERSYASDWPVHATDRGRQLLPPTKPF
ncbi:hypothetical protein AB0F72_08755 [Actinoplanes sp. NPDC023936]|uniref:hypothetical protein n=1 Tax=Actinoplanes sp. NPDC023936 TaxID=3154910 RepID=UPI0033F318E8